MAIVTEKIIHIDNLLYVLKQDKRITFEGYSNCDEYFATKFFVTDKQSFKQMIHSFNFNPKLTTNEQLDGIIDRLSDFFNYLKINIHPSLDECQQSQRV